MIVSWLSGQLCYNQALPWLSGYTVHGEGVISHPLAPCYTAHHSYLVTTTPHTTGTPCISLQPIHYINGRTLLEIQRYSVHIQLYVLCLKAVHMYVYKIHFVYIYKYRPAITLVVCFVHKICSSLCTYTYSEQPGGLMDHCTSLCSSCTNTLTAQSLQTPLYVLYTSGCYQQPMWCVWQSVCGCTWG